MSTPGGLGVGFAPYLLQHLKVVAANNAPETKVTPTGFLKLLLENNPMLNLPDFEKLRLSNMQGNIRNVQLSYLRRITPDQIQTSDNCDNDYIPVYSEMTLQTVYFNKFGFFISDETLAKYMEDASRTVAIGQPATDTMNEFITTLMTIVNGMIGKIDKTLISAVTFGKNIVSGNTGNTSTTINIEKDATIFDLSTGIGQLLNQLQVNEIANGETPLIAGAGNLNVLANMLPTLSAGLNGINNAEAFRQIKFYYDNYTQTTDTGFGGTGTNTNHVGVFSKGSIGFVDLEKYIGFRAGTKGISTFFRMPLPVMPAQNDGTADLMTFDCQLKYIDCPTTIFNGYSEVTVNRGWQLILSKNYGLFQLPADAYQSTDVLYGNNGALLYNFTNS